jgi:hypothetical protein
MHLTPGATKEPAHLRELAILLWIPACGICVSGSVAAVFRQFLSRTPTRVAEASNCRPTLSSSLSTANVGPPTGAGR